MNFTFNATCTALQQKISKTGNPYKVITLLLEDGHTKDFVATDGVDVTAIKKLTPQQFVAEVQLGKYTNVKIVKVA